MDDFTLPTQEEVAAIERRSRELDASEPRIQRAAYEDGRLVFELKGNAFAGTVLSFPAQSVPGLENATEEEVRGFVVTTTGSSIRWPGAKVGFGAPALVQLACGLIAPATAQATLERFEAARKMGSARTEAKSASSRANGAKGGRPRKKPVEA